jgi:phosphoribosylglycinamide formyltransferase 1
MGFVDEVGGRVEGGGTSMSLPIAVLLSGSGTTLQNLIDRIADGSLPVKIVRVISSKHNVMGIERALLAGLPTVVMERKQFPSVEAFSASIFEMCRLSGAKLVCLAGFLQLLRIPDDYHMKVMNIHPALLPAFGGKGMYGHHVHEAVLRYGAKVSGCTVHFADNEFDHGPIVLQRTVPVLDDDTPEVLAARVFKAECETYPVAIQAFAEGRMQIEDRRVRILPAS